MEQLDKEFQPLQNVFKLNKTGFKLNKRTIRYFDYMFVYYTKQIATGDRQQLLESLDKVPWKQGVKIDKIIKVDRDDQKSKGYFSISLYKSDILTYSQYEQGADAFNYDNKQSDKKQNQVVWHFQIEMTKKTNKYDAVQLSIKWQQFLQKQIQDFGNRQVFQDMKNYNQNQSIKTNALQNQKNKKFPEESLVNNNRTKKMQQEQDKQNELVRKKVEKSWEFRFNIMFFEVFQIVSNSSMTKKEKVDQIYKMKVKLNLFINQFKLKAQELAQQLILDLQLSSINMKYKGFMINSTRSNIMKYHLKEEQMIFEIQLNSNQKSQEECEEEDINDWIMNFQYYNKDKHLNHKFKSNKQVFKFLLNGYEQKELQNLRVILKCLVYYCGFKILVQSEAPIDYDENSQNNPESNESILCHSNNKELFDSLKKLGKYMNFKEHVYYQDGKFERKNIPLSYLTKIHQFTKSDEWTQDQNNTDKSSEKFRILQDFTFNQKFYYLNKLENLYPIQLDINQENTQYFSQKLRPELVESFGVQLNSDSFLQNFQSFDQNVEKDCVEVIEASNYLQNTMIHKLANDVDFELVKPYTVSQLIEKMHRYGINVRFLGVLATNIKLQNVVEIIEIEMVCRVLKQIINDDLQMIILNNGANHQRNMKNQNGYQSGLYSKIANLQHTQQMIKLQTEYCHTKLVERIASYFRLVLNRRNKESKTFWEKIIQIVRKQFNYKITHYEILPLGGIFMNLQDTLGVNIDFNYKKNFNDFSDIKDSDVELIYVKSKQYQIYLKEEELEIDKNMQYSSRDIIKHIKSLKMQIQVNLGANKNQINQTYIQCNYKLAYFYFLNNQTKECQKIINSMLQIIRDLHIDQYYFLLIQLKLHLNDENQVIQAEDVFDQILQLIQFNFGQFHPFYSEVYQEMAEYYMKHSLYNEANRLLKSSLVNMQRSVGTGNISTAQTYRKLAELYETQGDKQQVLENLYQSFQIINEGFKVNYPNLFLNVGFKLAKIQQQFMLFDKSYKSCDSCIQYISILMQQSGSKEGSDGQDGQEYHFSKKILQSYVEFNYIQLENAHGLYLIEEKILIIQELFKHMDNSEADKMNQIMTKILFHSLHCKVYDMAHENRHFIRKLIETVEYFKEDKHYNRKVSVQKFMNTFTREPVEDYFKKMLFSPSQGLIYNIQIIYTRNVFQEFNRIDKIFDQKNPLVSSINHFKDIQQFLGFEQMQKIFDR